jgi:hypothetical protein
MSDPDVPIQLSSLPFAHTLSPEAFAGFADALASIGIVENAEADTVLFREGDQPSDLGIVILEGAIKVQKPGTPEIEHSGAELLGEISRFNPTGLRTATVTTAQPCKLIRFAWANLEKAAHRRMSQADFDEMMKTLEEYAWQHFTE